MDEFAIQKRRGLIVWVYSLRQLKNLRRFGLIHFVSNKMKYVVLYINEEKVADTLEKIERLHFVRAVEVSYRPDIEMNFGEKIGTKAAFQESDEPDFEHENQVPEIRLAEHL
ncbi:YlbG family protein [Enterococcus sp. LJL98]